MIGAKKRALTWRKFEVTPARMQRGDYLVHAVMHCMGCHSRHDVKANPPVLAAKEGSGQVIFEEGGFRLVAPKITSDPETGIGKWSDDLSPAPSAKASRLPREQKWIAMMIGPEPATYIPKNGEAPGRWLRIPWLGDWKARRMNGYWAPEQPAKIKSLVKSLKEKLAGFEAVRSAAPYLVQMMARYTRLGEQIDAAFGGQALDSAKGPMDEGNKARFYTYLEMQKAVTEMKLRLIHEWMLVHGVNPEDPVQRRAKRSTRTMYSPLIWPEAAAFAPLRYVNQG